MTLRFLPGEITVAQDPWYQAGLRFSCTQCGNCCTGPPGYVWFTEQEAKAMAAKLNITLDAFYRQYAHVANGRYTLNERKSERGNDCVFLRWTDDGKSLCAVYESRPSQCRTWPFWPENIETPQDWQRAKRRCPGMDNGTLYPVDQIRIIRDRTPSR